MKHNIIKTDNYLLVVDDSEIKEWKGWEHHGKKVIAHLPLGNSSLVSFVDLLPSLEGKDELDKLAHKYNPVQKLDNEFIRAGFKAGYNKAREKFSYTEEDIIKAINFGIDYPSQIEFGVIEKNTITNFIQSLSQQKIPIGFECEMEEITIGGFIEGKDEAITIGKENKPKTTTTPEGHTQWVGEYIFN